MRISGIVSPARIPDVVDGMIVASGFESRCRTLYEAHPDIDAEHRVCLGFSDRKVLARTANDAFFAERGFSLIDMSLDEACATANCLADLTGKLQKDDITLLVDYSCFTKTVYAAILRFFLYSEKPWPRVRLVFSYSIPLYHACAPATHNEFAGPIDGFSGLDDGVPADRPTALVLGLGAEADRSLGLAEYIDPAVTLAFLSDASVDPRFAQDVKHANSVLLASVPPSSVFEYSVVDFHASIQKLQSVCYGLTHRYRVILAPLGPKPFSLACMLLSLTGVPCDVWRVSGGKSAKPDDVQGGGESVVTVVDFLT